MSKPMKAQDFRNKRIELENQLGRLSANSRSRFLKLCKANPDVVLYQYYDTVVTAKMIDRDSVQRIEGNEILVLMEVLEKYLESRNPRRQLEMDLDLKPQCPKIGICKVTPHNCACDMKDIYNC